MNSDETEPAASTFEWWRITMDIHPGKKGGRFDLPGGAHLRVSEGPYGKKDCISVALIPPNKRHEYCPRLERNEKLASNIYLIHAKPDLRSSVSLKLPSVMKEASRIVAMHKVAEEAWTLVNDVAQLDNTESTDVVFDKDFMTITTSSIGAFVLVQRPPTETFDVTPNGGLHNAQIHHLVSVRVPKRCTTYDGPCVFKIIDIDEERIARARALFPRDTSDIDCLSPFFDFSFPNAANGTAEFKRPVTLKLPLPDWCEEAGQEATASELAVMICRDGAWEALDAPMKLTKTTVSFDCRELTRFCLVRPRKDRRMRLHLSMPRLEASNSIIRGEILLFAMLEARAWHLWAECTPQSAVVDTISSRVKKGFTYLKKLPVAPPDPEEDYSRFSRFRNRRRSSQEDPFKKPEDVEFRNGSTFLLSLEGGLRFKPKSVDDRQDGAVDAEIAANSVHLQFHELFEDNYRCIEIEPMENLREKAEEFFLERVSSERAAKAAEREKEKALEREKRGRRINGLLNNSNNSNGTNGNGNSEPYTPPLPSPTEPSPPEDEQEPAQTEEDVEKEMAKLVFNASISCRTAPEFAGSGEVQFGENGPIFARFPLTVDADDLIDYFVFEAPPEVDPEAEAKAQAAAAAREAAAAAAAAAAAEEAAKLQADQADRKAKAKLPTESFNRLTASNKRVPKRPVVKESKVLSGRSLQVISRCVPHGLTLAVHLNLPDSVITGIGFDSLSNLQCLNDVTYKVLLHWKRTYGARDKDKMVPDLCGALEAMDLIKMSAVITDRHRNNMELTPGCFDY